MIKNFFKKLFLCALIFFVCLSATGVLGRVLPSDAIKAENSKFYLTGLTIGDIGFAEQWYLDKIKAPGAWEKTQGSKDVVVAIIDSGMDMNHPDLINNLWVNTKEIAGNNIDDDNNGYADDVHGWNFIENNNLPAPNLNNHHSVGAIHHGTAIAGIIAAEGNNAFATAGVAWHAQIMPLKVFNEDGESDTVLVSAAIEYAIKQKVDIINMSFVGLGYSSLLEAKIKAAYDVGILLVAAAGKENGVENPSDLGLSKIYPICFDGPNKENWVLGVVATDKDDKKAEFSNYGKSCVDISAPGVKIYSTLFHDAGNSEFAEYFGKGLSGTSVAVPQVVGAAVLIKALHPNYKNKQLMEVLMSSADNIDGANPYYLGQLGAGRLNVLRAIEAPAISMETTAEQNVQYVLGAKSGSEPKIWLLDAKGGVVKEFLAFAPSFYGGVNIAVGDVDDDGMAEIVVGAGSGGGPHIRIFNLSGELKYQFFAFDKKRPNGAIVAIGDTDGDGKNEIIAVEERSAAPVARVFNERGEILKDNIKIFANNISGAIGLVAGDVNRDGKAEIIASTVSGTAGKIKVITESGLPVGEFFPFGKNFYGGVNVAVGDLSASGWPEIIVSKRSGGADVKTFDYTGRLLSPGILVYDKYRAGVNLSSGDRDGDSHYEIITAPNGGGSAEIKVLDDNLNAIMSFYPLGKNFKKGLNAYIVTR